MLYSLPKENIHSGQPIYVSCIVNGQYLCLIQCRETSGKKTKKARAPMKWKQILENYFLVHPYMIVWRNQENVQSNYNIIISIYSFSIFLIVKIESLVWLKFSNEELMAIFRQILFMISFPYSASVIGRGSFFFLWIYAVLDHFPLLIV